MLSSAEGDSSEQTRVAEMSACVCRAHLAHAVCKTLRAEVMWEARGLGHAVPLSAPFRGTEG